MATNNQFNANTQVKEINGKRWVCEKISLGDQIHSDFVDNADGKVWRKIRPYISNDTKRSGDDYIAGTSQELDDKNP